MGGEGDRSRQFCSPLTLLLLASYLLISSCDLHAGVSSKFAIHHKTPHA